jgi:hypothetical protein
MIRKLLIGFGIFEAIAPRPVIRMSERIGLANPDEAQLRGRALVLARLEGLLFVWLLVGERERTPVASTLLGTLGAVAAFYPRPLIRLSQWFAYENPTELELNVWVEPAARLLGCLYLLVVFLSRNTETGID